MDRVFPFGFPFPTAFYLTLYVLTLVVHVIFMNYVLAGTGYLAVVGVGRWLRRRGGGQPANDVVFDLLRDWMPFILSAAITAGVAPLLFVQILYKENFYTANLLLFHRWMAILPVLIVGFYLLYLIKSKWMEHRSAAWLAWITVGALACFVFTGYTWTENHMLSLDRPAWPGHYESGAMTYKNPLLVPRFLMWAAGSVATMATLIGWQVLSGTQGALNREAEESGVRKLAGLALAGLLISFVAGNAYFWLQRTSGIDVQPTANLSGEALARPYSLLAVVGGVLQLLCWRYWLRRGQFSKLSLVMASLGLAATLIGVTVVRESIRLRAIDITTLYAQHARAAQVGGWRVFVAFLVINAFLIAWCIRLVRSNPARNPK